MGRGEFKRMTGLGDRTSATLLTALVKRGLLASDSVQGRVRFGMPMHALRFYFPALWPEPRRTLRRSPVWQRPAYPSAASDAASMRSSRSFSFSVLSCSRSRSTISGRQKGLGAFRSTRSGTSAAMLCSVWVSRVISSS